MDDKLGVHIPPSDGTPPRALREILSDAIRYWEPRRIVYNLALTIVAGAWLFLSWPHFRESLTLQSLGIITVLAMLANVCYCAAYTADVLVQLSDFQPFWRRWRWTLWLAGTLFAILLANYWIADEIYPFAR